MTIPETKPADGPSAPAAAASVFSQPPDLPTGTPAGPPAAAAPPPTTPDIDGAVWDGRFHEAPPRLNARGGWARLRGNAQRKAKGLPPSGASACMQSKPVHAPSPAAPPPPVEAAPTASTPPPPELTSSAPPPIHDGVPVGAEAPEQRPFESYAPTATGLVDGSFGVAQLTMGKAWELTPPERRAVTDATQRVLHHYQAPLLGPLIELILVLIPVITKRRHDLETRTTIARLITWWTERGKPQRQADPYRPDMPAPGSSAPASMSPPPKPPEKTGKIAWIP